MVELLLKYAVNQLTICQSEPLEFKDIRRKEGSHLNSNKANPQGRAPLLITSYSWWILEVITTFEKKLVLRADFRTGHLVMHIDTSASFLSWRKAAAVNAYDVDLTSLCFQLGRDEPLLLDLDLSDVYDQILAGLFRGSPCSRECWRSRSWRYLPLW